MKKIWSVAISAVVSACVFTSCDEDQEDVGMNMYTISGNSNGAQMSPAVTTTATGTITGSYDANTNTLNYTTTWTGLGGNATTGGFFGGSAGQNGAAIGSSWTLGASAGTSGTYTGTMTLTDAQETQLLNGGWYYTIGTATRTSGEIRGQVTATRM